MIKIFNHYFHKRTLLQIFFDLSLVIATVVLSVLTQVADPASVSSVVIATSLLLAAGIVFINAGLGFYQRVHSCTLGQTRARALLSLCLSLPLAYAVFRFSPLRFNDEKVFLLALLAGVGMMLIHRIYVTHATPRAMMRQRVLIYGSGTRARLVGHTLKNSDPNVELVGYYVSPNEDITEASAWHLFSDGKSLTDVVKDEHVDEIVVALSERRGGSMPLRELLDCKLRGVRVVDIATHFEKTLGQIRRDSLYAGWLIFGDGFEQGLLRTLVKRLFDIVCATLLILLALPVMLVTGLLILLESGGPILYLQERVGLHGRLFNVVKFRSMRIDAEKDGKPRWASVTDDRVTRVGRVIRKLRIDELPQLFSVLGGDMSLVGPRPERPYFVNQLTQELLFRGFLLRLEL
ncbi:MAG: exopolysaccharide biosynthesis polyprenyl glycosylphosphotransferase, partial [Pseudomonadota bacterium]